MKKINELSEYIVSPSPRARNFNFLPDQLPGWKGGGDHFPLKFITQYIIEFSEVERACLGNKRGWLYTILNLECSQKIRVTKYTPMKCQCFDNLNFLMEHCWQAVVQLSNQRGEMIRLNSACIGSRRYLSPTGWVNFLFCGSNGLHNSFDNVISG